MLSARQGPGAWLGKSPGNRCTVLLRHLCHKRNSRRVPPDNARLSLQCEQGEKRKNLHFFSQRAKTFSGVLCLSEKPNWSKCQSQTKAQGEGKKERCASSLTWGLKQTTTPTPSGWEAKVYGPDVPASPRAKVKAPFSPINKSRAGKLRQPSAFQEGPLEGPWLFCMVPAQELERKSRC